MKLVEELSTALDTREATVRDLQARYLGDVAIALLSTEQRDVLAHRLKSLRVPYCGLVVDTLVERLRLTGFTVDGTPDLALWERWREVGMDDGAGQVHRDALALGQGFASVWADEDGLPMVLPESATQCIVKRHPVTRRTTLGFKRWRDSGRAHAVLYAPDGVTLLTSASHVPDEVGVIPPNGWVVVKTLPNPLGLVPLVDITNPGRIEDEFGVSEMAAVSDLVDALQKVTLDGLLTSHETGMPRRWATGVEVEVDENGEGVDPWSEGVSTIQIEAAEARVGQLAASDMRGHDVLAGLLLRQIGALSGLPPQTLGLHADNAMSADALRASEAALVAKAERRSRTFGRSWARVGALMVATRDHRDPRHVRVTPLWADPAHRSEAQAADAAAKLYADGLLSREGVLERLGYRPDQIATENTRTPRQEAS